MAQQLLGRMKRLALLRPRKPIDRTPPVVEAPVAEVPAEEPVVEEAPKPRAKKKS